MVFSGVVNAIKTCHSKKEPRSPSRVTESQIKSFEWENSYVVIYSCFMLREQVRLYTSVFGLSGSQTCQLKSRQLFGPEIKYSNQNLKKAMEGPSQPTSPFCFVE